ncbi:branched-chain-amino-acid transaminase [Planctomycetota bacterium]
MALKIWMNGELVDEDQATVSIFDHGVLYGDGIFEGIRMYHGKVFKHTEHIDRLYDSARVLMLNIPMSKEEMMQAVVDTCAANNLTDAYIRLVITRGKGDLGINPLSCPKPSIFIIAATIALYPEELYETGLEVITAGTIRNANEALNPRVKSLNYLNNIMAKIEANNAGVAEVVMLNGKGYVAEGSADNLFIIKNKVVKTPPVTEGILEGITRNTIMDLAREEGYEVQECLLNRFDLYAADEFFFTGTGAELIPVIKYDGRVIGEGKPGPIFKKLRRHFREFTRTGG